MFGFNVYTRFLPLIYMVGIFVMVPKSSLIGHLCGILAALCLKFLGLSILFPRFHMIHAFDQKSAARIKKYFSYYEAKPELQKDFGCGVWVSLLTKAGLQNSIVAKLCCCAGTEFEGDESEL